VPALTTHDNADSVKLPHAPDFVLLSDRPLSDEQGKSIIAGWREHYASRLIVLGPGMKIERLPRVGGGRPGIVWGLRSPDGASRL
jgi:hypothetical protein